MKISFGKPALPAAGVLAIVLDDEARLGPAAAAIDRELQGAIAGLIARGTFRSARGAATLMAVPGNSGLSHILLLGAGAISSLSGPEAERLGGTLYDQLRDVETASLLVEHGADSDRLSSLIAFGARLRSYRFDRYRTREPIQARPKLQSLTVLCTAPAGLQKSFAASEAAAGGVFLARDLVSEPPNILYPESFAARAQELAKDGIEVEILGVRQMQKLGMHALLGVGQGSRHEAKLLVLRWNGQKNRKTAPLVFIGKGVCFDSGGISLKPGAGMWNMKYDMAGAAAVTGALQALARRKSKAHVIGICGLVENMPDAAAQRPGDVVRSMSGQTIEVQNTDAEGRLVLCDALWYAQQSFHPRLMVDLATLTGAVRQALSTHYAGLFCNDDALGAQLIQAGEATGERLWRLPMGEEYDQELNSLIADMKNIGGDTGGAITAAQFLQRFVKATKWAHLDIASVAWNEKGTPLSPPGSTGFGVRLLDRFVADNFE